MRTVSKVQPQDAAPVPDRLMERGKMLIRLGGLRVDLIG